MILADALGNDTTFRSLHFRIQASTYISGGEGARNTMSYKEENGDLVGITPSNSPSQVFDSLFGNYVPPDTDPQAAKDQDMRWRARKSILDLCPRRHRAAGETSGHGRQEAHRAPSAGAA